MRKKFVFVIMILLATVVLSGCTGAVAWPGLAADEQTAYLANGQFVYAINSSDGRERWHYPLQADSKLTFYTTPVVTSEGLVIIGSSGINHSLIAVNPQKFPDTLPAPVGGFQRFFCNIGLAICPDPIEVEEWIFSEAKDSWVAGPLALDGKIFAPNSDGNLYVLDLRDGRLIEKVTLDGDSNGPNRLWAQPTTDGERIFVTSLDHSVYAIDIETHEIIWHEGLGGQFQGALYLPPMACYMLAHSQNNWKDSTLPPVRMNLYWIPKAGYGAPLSWTATTCISAMWMDIFTHTTQKLKN